VECIYVNENGSQSPSNQYHSPAAIASTPIPNATTATPTTSNPQASDLVPRDGYSSPCSSQCLSSFSALAENYPDMPNHPTSNLSDWQLAMFLYCQEQNLRAPSLHQSQHQQQQVPLDSAYHPTPILSETFQDFNSFPVSEFPTYPYSSLETTAPPVSVSLDVNQFYSSRVEDMEVEVELEPQDGDGDEDAPSNFWTAS